MSPGTGSWTLVEIGAAAGIGSGIRAPARSDLPDPAPELLDPRLVDARVVVADDANRVVAASGALDLLRRGLPCLVGRHVTDVAAPADRRALVRLLRGLRPGAGSPARGILAIATCAGERRQELRAWRLPLDDGRGVAVIVVRDVEADGEPPIVRVAEARPDSRPVTVFACEGGRAVAGQHDPLLDWELGIPRHARPVYARAWAAAAIGRPAACRYPRTAPDGLRATVEEHLLALPAPGARLLVISVVLTPPRGGRPEEARALAARSRRGAALAELVVDEAGLPEVVRELAAPDGAAGAGRGIGAWLAGLHPDDLPRYHALLDGLLAGGRPSGVVRVRSGADGWQRVWLRLVPLRRAREGLHVLASARRIDHLHGLLPTAPTTGASSPRLSTRQLEVLRLIAQGKTNAEIAAEVFLTEPSVRNHCSAIYQRLGVRTRTAAIVAARRHGLLGSE